jgi:hypothetical protein
MHGRDGRVRELQDRLVQVRFRLDDQDPLSDSDLSRMALITCCLAA